jgi:small-conductance mechanosensitive channel
MHLHEELARLTAAFPWRPWAAAAMVAAASTLALAGAKRLAQRRLAALAPVTDTHLDDFFLELVRRTSLPFLVALSLRAALALVELPATFEALARGATLLVCLVQAGVWLSWTSKEVIERRFHASLGDADDPSRRTVGRMIALATRAVLWALLTLVALGNLGVDITALVAGLGVGGVAVALATQNILGDVFASVSILLDKPFVPGDFVIIDDYMGTVENIGIKTTRIRSLGGEQIVFSNADLLRSRLRNYKRMAERRVVFRLGVVYQTTPETLKHVPDILREIVEAQDGTRFDRSHFVSYGDFALVFETVYYVVSPDYNRYMDINQAINLEIARRFADTGIEFAYPTQTLLVQKAPPSPTAGVREGSRGGQGERSVPPEA